MIVPAPPDRGFLGRPERDILQQLRWSEIRSVKKGGGGRTLAFKVEFAEGTFAYFKPEQRISSANWYAEVAAFYVDRALGLGRVPAVASRRLPWALFEEAAADDPRAKSVVRARDKTVRGAMIAWLPGRLVPAVTPPGWENWIRVEPFPHYGVTPYQRSATYTAAFAEQRRRVTTGEPGQPYYMQKPDPPRPELPAELSDMIVFDFLTLNFDRFGADNANILTLGRSGPLVFLDNGDAFARGAYHRGVLDARLAPMSKFRRRTIDALRSLNLDHLHTAVTRDPLGPLLDEETWAAFVSRRDAILAHVDAQQRKFGDSVYAW